MAGSIQAKDNQTNLTFSNMKFLYDQTTERSKKRMIQMQKRKAYLNGETHQLEGSIQQSLSCTSEVTPNNIEISTQSQQDAINAFESNQDAVANVEVNVSDLDCSLDSNEKLTTQSEFLYKQSKPFIQLNNNLKIKAMTECNLQETSSYLLALKQKNRKSAKYSNINYLVDNIIREEREFDIENNINAHYTNTNTNPNNNLNKRNSIHKTSKSGEYTQMKKHFRLDSLNEKKIFQVSLASFFRQKKKDKANNLKIVTSFDLSVFKPKKLIKSSEFNALKPKMHIRTETSFKSDISFSTNTHTQTDNSKRNKTKNKNKACSKIIKSESNHYNSNSNSNYMPKLLSQNKITHRKNLTINFPPQKKFKNQHVLSNCVFHRKTNSISNSTNKDIILALLEKLKYNSNDHLINALKYARKSKKNMIVLIKKNPIPTNIPNTNINCFLFQAIYEIGLNNEYGCKIYSVVFCPFKIHSVEIKNSYLFDEEKRHFSLVTYPKQPYDKMPLFENIHCITI